MSTLGSAFFSAVRWLGERSALDLDLDCLRLPLPASRRYASSYPSFLLTLHGQLFFRDLLTPATCSFALAKTVEKKGASSPYLRFAKLALLWSLIALETGSAFVRTREYLSRSGASLSATQSEELASKVAGFARSSAVKSDGVGKAKQTLEMVGTALYMIPMLRPLGLSTLFLALPLAIESVARKVSSIYFSEERA